MKKLLAILCILTIFVACSDDKDDTTPALPIEGLKLPAEGTTFTTGEAVTITGKGFKQGCEIWLRAVTKAEGDIQTEVTEVNDNSLTFTVPEKADGQKKVILKQEGKEYILGILIFKIDKEKVYVFRINKITGNQEITEININNGSEKLFTQITTPGDFASPVFISSTNEIIGLIDKKQLLKINLATREETIINLATTSAVAYDVLVIDDEENLYAYKRDYTNSQENYIKQIVKININTGKEESIAKLEFSYPHFEDLVYVSSTKEIVGIVYEDLLKVNVETGISTSVVLDNNSYQSFVTDHYNNLYALQTNSTDYRINHIVKIDYTTGKTTTICSLTLDETGFYSPIYFSSTSEIIGFVQQGLQKINVKTGNSNVISLENTNDIEYYYLIKK